MGLIEINYCVMPDLIRHPEYLYPSFLDSGFRRNDKSLRDNGNFSSPKGEGFQPSPKETLKVYGINKRHKAYGLRRKVKKLTYRLP